MKILGITSRLPWPLTDGARIVMYQAVRGLAMRGHELHLVTMEEGEPGEVGDLREYATLHVHHYRPEPRALGALRTLLHPRPYTHLRKDFAEVERMVAGLLVEHDFDLIYGDQSHTAHYASAAAARSGLPWLFRSHNVEHEIWRRHIEGESRAILRPWLRSQYRKWKEFETAQMAAADLCAAITDRDGETIQRLVPGLEVMTIPAAVDLDRFATTSVSEREPATLLLLGGMGWAPNRDAAIWFANDILPLVRRTHPDVRVRLVGSDPPRGDLPPSDESFRIEGYVEDILPYYGSATIGVIPLRVGGGMRVKIVEMMSAGLPCVSTPIGAEGNRARAGEHYLCGETAGEIADRIGELLDSPQKRRALAERGRAFVEETYGFDAVADLYDRAVRRTVEIHRSSTGGR